MGGVGGGGGGCSGRGGGVEEEEEHLLRSHGRWAWASSPGGPTQTSQGSPPSYLRKSQTYLAADLRTLFRQAIRVSAPANDNTTVRSASGSLSPTHYGPICLRVPVTNRLRVVDPPESPSQNRPARRRGSPRGITPD